MSSRPESAFADFLVGDIDDPAGHDAQLIAAVAALNPDVADRLAQRATGVNHDAVADSVAESYRNRSTTSFDRVDGNNSDWIQASNHADSDELLLTVRFSNRFGPRFTTVTLSTQAAYDLSHRLEVLADDLHS